MKQKAELISSDLQMCDGSRWHDGKLWFSDMPRGKVMTYDPKRGALEVAVQFDHCSGLGWDSKGRMYISARNHVMRWDGPGKKPETLAELPSQPGGINDLVTLPDGRSYGGGIRAGFTADPGREDNPPGFVLTIDPDGKGRIAADTFRLPNGIGVTPDGKTLIVGETYGRRLNAFDIQADGSLKNRRVWADLGEAMPDGFCFDSEGCIWVSSISTHEFIRVAAGGKVKERVPTPDGWRGLSCVLGGEDRRTLFMLTNTEDRSNAALWMTRVKVAGGGGFP